MSDALCKDRSGTILGLLSALDLWDRPPPSGCGNVCRPYRSPCRLTRLEILQTCLSWNPFLGPCLCKLFSWLKAGAGAEAPASPYRFAALRVHEAPRSRICPDRSENVGFLVLQSTALGTPPFSSVKAPRSLRATDRLHKAQEAPPCSFV